MIDPNITNSILKLRTWTYPLMPLLKHRYPPGILSDNCMLCNNNSRETLAHVILTCPELDTLRQGFICDIFDEEGASKELLHASRLIDWRPRRLNMFAIHAFLRLRWNKLDPLLTTIKERLSDDGLSQQRN